MSDRPKPAESHEGIRRGGWESKLLALALVEGWQLAGNTTVKAAAGGATAPHWEMYWDRGQNIHGWRPPVDVVVWRLQWHLKHQGTTLLADQRVSACGLHRGHHKIPNSVCFDKTKKYRWTSHTFTHKQADQSAFKGVVLADWLNQRPNRLWPEPGQI